MPALALVCIIRLAVCLPFNEGNSGGLGDGGLGVGGGHQYVELELPRDDSTRTTSELPPVEPPFEEIYHVDTSTEFTPEDSSSPQQTVRRSTREKRMPDYYSCEANLAGSYAQEPYTLEEVLATPEKDHWFKAMEKEMRSLQEYQVWDLVELPKGRKPIWSKWVFKIKTNEDGNIERYKARLVAQGYTQKFGTDYDETF